MSKENEENESEINEIEYLSASKEISEDDNFLDNEDYNIFNENNSEEDNDNDNDNDDDNDIMKIDKERLNKEDIEGIILLHLKLLYNFTEAAYNDIIKLFANKNISLYKIKKILEKFIGLISTFYDICENSCIYYTDVYESYQNYPLCNSSRYNSNNKPKKVMPYLSIKEMLKIQYNNKVRAKELLYHYEYITNKELDDNDLNDIFDRDIYKELLEKNLFKNNRNIAFTISCDRYQIFKQKKDDCWAFLIINNNLNPLIRVKKENLLIPFLIPGSKQLKDFNTFLRSFINEMKELEGKYFI